MKRDDSVWRHDEERGRMTLVATKAAFAALGIDARDAPVKEEAESADDGADPPKTQRKIKPHASRTAAPRTRDGSTQAQLIAMLRRAKGAPSTRSPRRFPSNRTSCVARSPAHSRKSLGLEGTSENDDKRGRIYRVI